MNDENGDTSNELEPATETNTLAVTDELVARFEHQAKLYQERFLPTILRLTNASDWRKLGDKYYLESSGAEKAAIPLGIEWGTLEVKKHDIGGGQYEFEISGIMTSKLLKRSIWVTGNCDSRDQFLTARPGWDMGTIRKAAMSNFIVNGVTRIAGIRNPTLEMLKRAGINPGAVGSVDYSGNKSADESKGIVSDAQQKRLWAIAKGKGVDEAALREIVARDPWKFTSLKDITRQHYDAIVKAVQDYEPNGNGERQPGEEG